MIRLGVHTIVWGPDCTDLCLILREAKEAGYSGIELFHNPASFFPELKDCARRFQETLDAFDVELLGICFGAFEDRMAFVEELSVIRGVPVSDRSLPYLYTDQWDDECEEALARGMRVAIHPHMYQPIQTMAEAEVFLDHFPMCELLPDTTHMMIAGEDIRKVLKEKSQRIAAIHLKDWQSNVGRSYQFYARGFCGLGEGDVKWNDFIPEIVVQAHRASTIWLIVDQDRSATPMQSVKKSNLWVREQIPRQVISEGKYS